MRDPYQILGVAKSATPAELKSAYRKLAKKLHPDVNPGRKDIEQKFKEVTAAYDLLSDEAKRARFDRGEIDDQGNERGFGGGYGGYSGAGGRQWRGTAGQGGGQAGGQAGDDPFSQFGSMDDILAEFMGAARRGRGGAGAQQDMQGGDVTYSIAIPFAEAALGGKRRVTLENGKTIDITIPPGTEEGHKLRLRGQGKAGGQTGAGKDAAAGDALIEIHIEPHPIFVRKDNDILLEAPVSLPEAVLGASIQIPTLDGQVALKVPKGANSGTTLRLKGKGVPIAKGGAGDMLVRLRIVMPETITPDLAEFMEKWAKKNGYDPRKGLKW
jgi:DnaJ-class molecular chaperone